MARSKSKQTKDSKQILENPDALADRLSNFEQYIENNPTPFYVLLGVIALLIGGFFGGRYYIDNQNLAAQNEMFQAEYYFQQDSLDLALYGDGNYYGFLDIVDNYGLTKAADLAGFYTGIIFMKKGQYEDAIEYLKKYKGKDVVLQGRAYSLIGDAYVELNDFSNAITFYKKAVDYKPNEYNTPLYMEKLALVYEENGNLESCLAVYENLVDAYPATEQARDARKHKQRLETLLSN